MNPIDYIEECFNENRSLFTAKLQEVGFTEEQANKFFPEAAEGILDSTHNSGIAQKIGELLSDDPSTLLASIDVESIAQTLGMSSGRVKTGLEAIAPVLSKILLEKGDGIAGDAALLGKGAKAKFLKSAKKFFS